MGKKGVNYSGAQVNAHSISTGSDAAGDFGSINFNNIQTGYGSVKMNIDDNMVWEKSQGVMINPTGKFKDWDVNDAYSVDLSQKITCVGMPNENINGNSSNDCYSG